MVCWLGGGGLISGIKYGKYQARNDFKRLFCLILYECTQASPLRASLKISPKK